MATDTPASMKIVVPADVQYFRSVRLAVGGLGALVGGLWWGVAGELGGEVAAPAAVTILGVGLIGGGIAMIVIGGKKVPADPTDGSAEPPAVASPVPEVAIGLGSVQAKWQF